MTKSKQKCFLNTYCNLKALKSILKDHFQTTYCVSVDQFYRMQDCVHFVPSDI